MCVPCGARFLMVICICLSLHKYLQLHLYLSLQICSTLWLPFYSLNYVSQLCICNGHLVCSINGAADQWGKRVFFFQCVTLYQFYIHEKINETSSLPWARESFLKRDSKVVIP